MWSEDIADLMICPEATHVCIYFCTSRFYIERQMKQVTYLATCSNTLFSQSISGPLSLMFTPNTNPNLFWLHLSRCWIFSFKKETAVQKFLQRIKDKSVPPDHTLADPHSTLRFVLLPSVGKRAPVLKELLYISTRPTSDNLPLSLFMFLTLSALTPAS